MLLCLYYLKKFYTSERATTILRVFHTRNLLQIFECVRFPNLTKKQAQTSEDNGSDNVIGCFQVADFTSLLIF